MAGGVVEIREAI
uniref:Uncharacterized protein n=1 Tax=Vitis vinifera TaxID=29760 RepID=F6HCD3_VITVI